MNTQTITPLGEVTTYNFKENNQYDEEIVKLTKKYKDLEYNKLIEDAIIKRLASMGVELTEPQKQALGTRVFFAQSYIRDEEKANQGYKKLTMETIKELKENIGKKIELTKQGMLGGHKKTFFIREDMNGNIMFQTPRQRTRGYAVIQYIDDSYYKFI